MNIQNILVKVSAARAKEKPAILGEHPAYLERLTGWEEGSGVRHWSLGGDRYDGKGVLPFSLELVPLVHHNLVRDRGEIVRNNVLAQHLYRFCSFTERLELEAVVQACIRLRFAEVGFAVPPGLSRDAGLVVIDEAWHAQCAGNLTARVGSATGFAPCRSRTPGFLYVLHFSKASLSKRHRMLADMVFACVSETLITGTLTRVPRDVAVMPDIRGVLGEHAREEAFHHSIFTQVIGVLWEQLSPSDRDVLGPLFALYIDAFLRPDSLAEKDGLEAAGFSAADARRIVEETREDENGVARLQLWKAAMPTVRSMELHGLLAHAATRETLEMMNLLRPADGRSTD